MEKEVAYREQSVEADLTFASDIEKKTWNKSVIRIEASVESGDIFLN